ncbi:CDP-glycerol glycerophosphotransferase family protein [Microbulbifer rhizosphaerae]|uniref:CDP-glycerol glycerophosphotransferase n=1 Tax=Microbulbifer rhizosphaerae TaxID=1562603 RepID=A0A7W4ZBA0_9GAMM|nr:CDP-glycerol glycerophosphotransferase [Microbulbifer rhizosphaerae]
MKAVTQRLLAVKYYFRSLMVRPRPDIWLFYINRHQTFEGNIRALWNYCNARGEVQTYLIDYRGEGRPADVSEAQYVPGGSRREIHLRLRCRYCFISHSQRLALGKFSLVRSSRLVNLWHGIPIKAIGNLDERFTNHQFHREFRKSRRIKLFSVASVLERSIIAGAFVSEAKKIKVFGLPRNDFLGMPYTELPGASQQLVMRARSAKAGRRFLLYAPTFRDYDRSSVGLGKDDLHWLEPLLQRHNALLGIRPHPRDLDLYRELIDSSERIVDCSQAVYDDVSCLMREVDLLISDFSSIWVDYLLLDRPIVFYAWDLQRYMESRGFAVPFDRVLPSDFSETTEQLQGALEEALREDAPVPARQQWVKGLFHQYPDFGSCARLYRYLQDWTEAET